MNEVNKYYLVDIYFLQIVLKKLRLAKTPCKYQPGQIQAEYGGGGGQICWCSHGPKRVLSRKKDKLHNFISNLTPLNLPA